jgi:hypothetical protein
MGNIYFKEGTINFWIPKGKLDYKDNKFANLFYHKEENGELKIIKDKDNGLKVYYLFEGNKALLNVKADYLEDEDKHMITVTWSLPEKKISLYVDGKLKVDGEISTAPF